MVTEILTAKQRTKTKRKSRSRNDEDFLTDFMDYKSAG
jgi:hypothetical protein